jgi:hypothetical protein
VDHGAVDHLTPQGYYVANLLSSLSSFLLMAVGGAAVLLVRRRFRPKPKVVRQTCSSCGASPIGFHFYCAACDSCVDSATGAVATHVRYPTAPPP